MNKLGTHFLDTITFEYRKLKDQADKALNQVNEDKFDYRLDDESNTLDILIRHLSGNMRSRWTDFLTSDGEKESRDRVREFDLKVKLPRGKLMEYWKDAWNLLFETISSLQSDDLLKTITIRGEEHTVIEALQRQLTHYAAHIGQIMFLAKHLAGDRWQSLSIPRDQNNYQPSKYKS